VRPGLEVVRLEPSSVDRFSDPCLLRRITTPRRELPGVATRNHAGEFSGPDQTIPPHTTKLVKRDPSRTGTILAASAATLYNMYRARKVAATRIRHILAALGIEIRPRGSLGRLAAVRARAAVGLLSVKWLTHLLR
jgi:hypothetical protein